MVATLPPPSPAVRAPSRKLGHRDREGRVRDRSREILEAWERQMLIAQVQVSSQTYQNKIK